MSQFLRRSAAVAALLIAPQLVQAQSLRDQTSSGQSARRAADASVAPVRQIISINPVLPILGWFQGEYEARLQDNLAFALAGSYTEFDNDNYANFDAKLRLYPQERGLQGLGLAAGLGVGNIKREKNFCDVPDLSEPGKVCRLRENAASFSVEGHYQWLLGNKRSTAITMGGGVKRYFISDDHDAGINRIMPTLRLSVGYAFR